MASLELEKIDHMRDNVQMKHYAVVSPEFLPNEIGAVSDEKELPPTDDLFSSREPYHLDPAGVYSMEPYADLFTEDSDEQA